AALRRIAVRVLLVSGDGDPLAADAKSIAALIPKASYIELQGRDHMSAVPARAFKEAALAFLRQD
nr:alpha/beta hydrolase [Candidatus Dormibacteraeota bacterium]